MNETVVRGSISDANRKERETEARGRKQDEEAMRDHIRENENDLLEGLFASADYVANEELTFEIKRAGRLYFSFTVTPLSEETLHKIRKKYTNYVKNRRTGIKQADDLDVAKYRCSVIYNSTVARDKERIWDNMELQDGLKKKGYHIMNALDVIEALLLPGEKEKIMQELDRLGGDMDDEDEGNINDEGKRIEKAKNL